MRGPESARRLLPPGRGRGSSVSSIVCYLTGLSHVDPIANELLLGRFLNEELTALPDIDLDFPRDIRDVLIPRVHDRYGRDRCALVAAFSTFQVRSAVRDFAKALGLPPGEIERLARQVDPWKDHNDIEGEVPRGGSPRWDALVKLAHDAWGLPRHQSQHPGGMVIATQPLIDLCPVQPASMEGRQMVQWDKDSCGDAGFLKIDLLGLGMLSAVERCIDEIARVRGERHRPVADPVRRQGGLRAHPGGGDHRRLPDRVARADADAEADPAGDARRPHRAGGARAARADHRRGGAPLHRAAQGAARRPLVRGALRAPLARAGAARHARHDRLPGPGARGGDGLRRLQRGRGGGPAAGDEPAPLRGGDPRLRGEVPGRGGRARGHARDRLDRVDPDRRLLGLRLPEGALGGLRAARLPVHLAAGALPPGVPLRAPERAADGLLPAGRAGARGAAARGGGAAAVRGQERGGVPGRGRRRPDGPRLRDRREGGRGARDGRPSAAPAGARSATWPAAPAPRPRRSAGSPGRAPATRSWRATSRAGGAARSGCWAWRCRARRCRRAPSSPCRWSPRRGRTCARSAPGSGCWPTTAPRA